MFANKAGPHSRRGLRTAHALNPDTVSKHACLKIENAGRARARRERQMRFLAKAMVLLLLFAAAAGYAPHAANVHDSRAEAVQRDSRWAEPVRAEGLPNLYRVNSEVYRSGQPEGAGLRSAENLGVKTVLSLRSTNRDGALDKSADLLLRNVPMRSWNTHDEDIISALRVIHDAPKPILVHCRHGADRTGLIMAMYWVVFQGWTKEQAKKEMLEGGYGFHAVWVNITRRIDTADIAAIRARIFKKQSTAAVPALQRGAALVHIENLFKENAHAHV